MCFIKICSCKFSGIPTSSSQASSFNDLTFYLFAEISPIIFIKIKEAITNPIPTA